MVLVVLTPPLVVTMTTTSSPSCCASVELHFMAATRTHLYMKEGNNESDEDKSNGGTNVSSTSQTGRLHPTMGRCGRGGMYARHQ